MQKGGEVNAYRPVLERRDSYDFIRSNYLRITCGLEQKALKNKIINFLLGCMIGLVVCLPMIWELIERMIRGG